MGGDVVVDAGTEYEGGATSFSATGVFSLLDMVSFWAVVSGLTSLLFRADFTAS
jgi:hypothetical protein